MNYWRAQKWYQKYPSQKCNSKRSQNPLSPPQHEEFSFLFLPATTHSSSIRLQPWTTSPRSSLCAFFSCASHISPASRGDTATSIATTWYGRWYQCNNAIVVITFTAQQSTIRHQLQRNNQPSAIERPPHIVHVWSMLGWIMHDNTQQSTIRTVTRSKRYDDRGMNNAMNTQ